MSYILQALKKSEEQRQQALEEIQQQNEINLNIEAAQIDNQNASPENEEAETPFAFYGVIALIVIAVAAVVINLFNSTPEAENESQQALVNQVDTLNQQIEKIGKQLKQQSQEAIVVPAQQVEIQKNTSEQDSEQAPEQSEINSVEPVAIEAAPESVTSTIPNIEISSHIYSNNEAYRSAVINGVRLKEKEYLSKDIQVVQIKPTGVVLKVKQDGQEWLLLVSRNLGWKK